MSWMPEPEPTPLRLRLGPRSEVPLPPAFEDADSFDVAEDLDARIESASAQTLEPAAEVAEPIEAKDPLRAAASEELQRAIEQTAERVDKWMADQRYRPGFTNTPTVWNQCGSASGLRSIVMPNRRMTATDRRFSCSVVATILRRSSSSNA